MIGPDKHKPMAITIPALAAVSFIGLAAAALAAQDLPAAPPQTEAAPAADQGAAVVPLPAGSEQEFHYSGKDRRDPFRSLLILEERKKKDVTALPPIQQVDVLAFRVIGIIVDKVGGNRAMVQAPDGKSYVVKKGDILGKNEGEVVAVDMEGISVRERLVDFMGKESFVNTVLRVPEKLR